MRRAAALAAILSLLAEPSAPVFAGAAPFQTAKPSTAPPTTTTAKPATGAPPAAQKPAAAQPATAKPAAAAAAPAPVDGGWPRMYNLASGGSILVYAPQIASWVKHSHMVAFSAVSYRPKTGKPAMGTIKLESETKVAVNDRLVSFSQLKIVETNFHELAKENVREITAEITKAFPPEDRVIALDRVLASFDKSQIIPNNVEGIKADAPPIFFSTTPAVIVVLDGEPIWSPINQNDLKFAVNTNWDLFQHTATNTYFLRHNDTWLKATDLKGAWTPAGTLPDSFKKLPAEENWKDVKANLPGRSSSAKAVPKVFVTFVPGELILLTGQPNYLMVGKTDLLWVSNTESDLFRLGKTGPVYYLVAGRWFSAPDFNGPWTFATTSLPPAFKSIPLEHDRSRVLASVPGTDQAAEAVLLAQIPQTARVNRKETKAPEVAFNGNTPEFQAIEKTSVQRAVNTDKDIFKVGDLFYMCYQGVWFFSTSASGPWEVATMVPQEIYQIPVSSPAHHVTYVTIEEDDDDDWVVYAAAAGYTGMMVAWGCAVWGSGWYYPPYYGYGGFYPYYYPHFPTYGYSAWYNPWTGAYGRSAGVYGPYGGAGVAARYNPRTGTYARGAAAHGPYGSRGVAQAYNPRTGTYASTRQGSNVYGSWGSTAVQRGDDWAATNRYTNNRTGTTTRTVRTDDGAAVSRRGDQGGVVAGSGGDVYAGRDGNVYRKQDGGSWQKYENGGWNNTDRQPDRSQVGSGTATPRTTTPRTETPRTTTMDSSTRDQLDRDTAARREGTQRANDYGAYRGGSNTTTRGTGSYRGGGGGGGARPAPRGGGGRRR